LNPTPTPTIAFLLLGPQKVKNDPKIKAKSKVRIEETNENRICLTT